MPIIGYVTILTNNPINLNIKTNFRYHVHNLLLGIKFKDFCNKKQANRKLYKNYNKILHFVSVVE